jgi:predicted PurR-regulated permease PerM
MALDLTPRQQKAVASALTVLAGAVVFTAVGFVIWLLAYFLKSFSTVFLPLAVAAVLALVVQPYYEWFAVKRRVPPGVSVLLVFLSFIVPLALVLVFFGTVLTRQIGGLADDVPLWWESVKQWVEGRTPVVVEMWERYGLQARLEAALEGKGDAIVSGLQSVGAGALDLGAGVMSFFGAVFGWAIMPVYFAFFLMMPRPSTSYSEVALPFLKPETREDVVYLIREFVEIVVAFFRGQIVVALLQGLLFAIGFTVVGLRYGFILGLILGLLNIVPYLGSIIGMAVCLPLAFFQQGGGWTTVAAVLVVFGIVQVIEGYVLTPRIMGETTGLHPMAIIFSIFFWGAALQGILGMILAIPLTAFLVVFWRLAREKYITELV